MTSRLCLSIVFILFLPVRVFATDDPEQQRVPGSDQFPAAESRLGDLGTQLKFDFERLFTTRENLVILGAGLAAAWGAGHADETLASSGLNSELNEDTKLDYFFEAGEILGGGLVQVGGAAAAWGAGRLFANEGMEELGQELLRAQIVTQSLTMGIKLASRRERPDGLNRRSFPSGHASGTFATATVLQRRFGWGVGVPAYVAAGYIATSRLNEGRHYLSDVVFGAALGIMVGRTITFDVGKQRFRLNPTPVAGGAGLQVSLVP